MDKQGLIFAANGSGADPVWSDVNKTSWAYDPNLPKLNGKPEEARRLLSDRLRDSPNLRHAVWLEGEIVCTGTASPTEHGLLLYGGATAPHARGRGAYRALIRARWDDAVARGTPALITQGGSMSRPILERLGFERVGEVHMLLDAFG